MGWSADSLAVGVDGKRFTAESDVSFLGPWASGTNYYSIYSSSQIDRLATKGFDTDRNGPSFTRICNCLSFFITQGLTPTLLVGKLSKQYLTLPVTA